VKRGRTSSCRNNIKEKQYNATRHGIYIWKTYLLKLAMPALGTPDEEESDCD
jgi:hypothetical protein